MAAECNDPTHADLIEQMARMRAEIAEMRAAHAKEVAALRAEIAELKAKLGRNSTNSSRPPSSDPPFAKQKRPSKPTGRRPGGQPGHPGHHRKMVDVGEVDHFEEHFPPACAGCGQGLAEVPDPDPLREQKWEIPEVRPTVTEHRFHAVTCPHCGESTVAEAGPEVPRGAFGPRAEAIIAYLRGSAHLSLAETQRVCADLFNLDVSTGGQIRICERVSQGLEAVYDEALKAVRESPVVYADETPWFLKHALSWLWFAGDEALRVFRVDVRRSAEAAERLLGETLFGILVTDRYAVYSSHPADKHQFCLAHVKRNIEALITLGGAAKIFGEAFASHLETAFREWRNFEEVHGDRDLLCERLSSTWGAIVDLLASGTESEHDRVAGFCRHLIMEAEALWTFTVEECPPTNNLAEQSMRRPVLWRRVSLGSQSEAGCRFVERILTTVETLRTQGRNILRFLVETMGAAMQGRAPPSLLPPRTS